MYCVVLCATSLPDFSVGCFVTGGLLLWLTLLVFHLAGLLVVLASPSK